ncbi:hypothetical protein [Desulfococcus sp.]|uniref:DUF6909 family protein n=1 Tax=Desulfococcus sp. TaxID=2025834 RepID=UPI0035938575
MQDLTRAQKARMAIRSFKTIAHALALRGFYMPSEKLGQQLAECLLNLGPEIYGTMNDPRITELKGLEYVIDRLPRGIEKCTRIILTEEEQIGESSFEIIEPLKRRRTCYRISEKEICFAVTRGLSEIYDILTHLTFLYIEARKLHARMADEAGNITIEWNDLEKNVQRFHHSGLTLSGRDLDQAIWNLSIILGRSYNETRQSYEHFEKNKRHSNRNDSFFSLIYHLGNTVAMGEKSREDALVIYLTPSLMSIIGHQRYGHKWSLDIKARLMELGLQDRPLHVISANLHSTVNLLYGYAFKERDEDVKGLSLYDFIVRIREQSDQIRLYARDHGMNELPDQSGSHIDCQIIDTARLQGVPFHPKLAIDPGGGPEKPVLLVMDYAFGAQAFEVMDCLLNPYSEEDQERPIQIASISVMGKAGILPGKKGDIMLATAHVIEGTSDNYIFHNDLVPEDFDGDIDIYVGPMITVLGTSLQNRDMLSRFQSSWNTVGLEMEGGHYQRAINAAIIKGHISGDVRVRYAYYASDNPLVSGQTLAAGDMGHEGVRPTYMVTKVILEKIFGTASGGKSNESGLQTILQKGGIDEEEGVSGHHPFSNDPCGGDTAGAGPGGGCRNPGSPGAAHPAAAGPDRGPAEGN